jgi:type II secretory pathway component PulM
MEMQLETMEAECAHLKGLLEEVVKLKGRSPESTFEETKLSPPNEQSLRAKDSEIRELKKQVHQL